MRPSHNDEVIGVEEHPQSSISELNPQLRAASPRLADLGARADPAIAILALAAICAHLLLKYIPNAWVAAQLIPLYAVLLFGGAPLVFALLRKILAREFGSDLLAGLSIVVSILMGQYLVGAIVVLMLSGGTALENFATRRASSVLEALSRRMPNTAHLKTDAGLAEIETSKIRVGDILIVLPHEICPVDGVVLEGDGRMNEAYLTGEPFETSKVAGSQVLSGAVNGESALTIAAGKLAIDSRYAKIMRVMHETQQKRPRLRGVGDMLGAWYTPLALALAAAAWIASGDAHRFLAVLVVATPCPLLLAIPVAVIGAISLAARRSIIVKNPAVLERIGQCTTLIFDKTGTLTYGRPTVTQILCAEGILSDEVLRTAASLETYSKHPLAGAIVTAATKAGLILQQVSAVSETPGDGLRGVVAGQDVWITGRSRVAGRGIALPNVAAGLECVIFIDDKYAATFRFRDVPRAGSRSFVRHLGPRHKVTRTLLVSGDRESEVKYLAALVGIEHVICSASPKDKVSVVRAEAASAKTLFVGDGINDAPAMQAATVGVAFGMSSDFTAEAADAVVLEPSFSKVDELMHIGRRMRSIALLSAAGGMGLSLLGMLAASFGFLTPVEGAIAQELIDLAAVLNALRVAFPFDRMTDFQ